MGTMPGIEDEGLSMLLDSIRREHLMREGTLRVLKLKNQVQDRQSALDSKMDSIRTRQEY